MTVFGLLLLLFLWLPLAGAQTTILFEGFEGAFPEDNGWTVGDSNPADTPAWWNDVDAAFGGEGTHSGGWKGYCAGTSVNPVYANSMTAFMQKSIDLTGYVSASLDFWLKIPGIEACCDICSIYVDATPVWSSATVTPAWTETTISLNSYLGGVHTLKFEFSSDVSVTDEGWYLDDILVTGIAPPANDNFPSAASISGTAGTTAGSNVAATKEAGEPNHFGNPGGASIWYRWTAPSSGVVTFNTVGSSFDTLLAVYTGGAVGSLTQVAANDDGEGTTSTVTFNAANGTEYKIAIDGFSGATGSSVLNWLYPAVNETVLSVSVANYTGYVIDSDADNVIPAYNREDILVDSSVRSDNLSSAGHFTTYVLSYRLLGPGSQPHPIFDSAGVTNATYTYNATNTYLIGGFGAITRAAQAALRPAARLDPFGQYTVELKILREGVFTGATSSDGPRTYYHFTNRVSGDAAFNVIATLDNGFFSRTYAVTSVPGKDTFIINPIYTLRRFDNFSPAVNVIDTIPVVFTCVLSNVTTGAVVPLKNSQTTVFPAMDSFDTGGAVPLPPRVNTLVAAIPLEPAMGVQLDSVNDLFRVHISLAHTNQPGSPAVPANRLVSLDQRLLHFNGRLLFGAIQTTFDSIDNAPSPLSVVPGSHVNTQLGVSVCHGFITGKPGQTYGGGVNLDVRLLNNGDAALSVGVVPLCGTSPGGDEIAHVRFERVSPYLSPGGAFSDLRVTLPTGLGYRTDTSARFLSPTYTLAGVSLNQSLAPGINPTLVANWFICEETKPVWIETSQVLWGVNNGNFQFTPTGMTKYVRRDELNALDAPPPPLVDADMAIKRSNEQYFRGVSGVNSAVFNVRADANGNALLSVNLGMAPSGHFSAHFPYNAVINWGSPGGALSIADDQMQPVASSLVGVSATSLPYARDCAKEDCPGGMGPETLTLNPAGGELRFTPDGGLAAAGTFSAPTGLNWGWITAVAAYAQRTTPFSAANFHMPGVFLRGDQTVLGQAHRPAALLYTGVGAADLSNLERYGTSQYQAGSNDYAGFNFRVISNGLKQAESVLAGHATGLYPLTGRSKYYVRAAGVSGIHEAVFGSFPLSAVLYGYVVNFSNYGLSYLDSQNKDSRTQGDIRIPYPSDFTQEFEELTFTCLGALDTPKVPSSSGKKTLQYWLGDFITLAIKFENPSGCDPTSGFLVLGVSASAAHISSTLHGKLGFKADGNLITAADALVPGLNSRFTAPNTISLKGPAGESYTFVSVGEVYYNNYSFSPGSAGNGFVSLAGKLDVPFFEDLKVHLHTSANTNVSSPNIYLMGGWPQSGSSKPNRGWRMGGDDYFSKKDFDDANRAFPYEVASPVTDYEKSTGEVYHTRAQQRWLGVVDFDYPLDWSSSTRAFKSHAPVEASLLVLSASHEVKYLSARHAELAFGIQYKGVPQINLANIAFNAVSETTGVAAAITNAIGSVAHAAIEQGLGRLDQMLQAQLQQFFDPIFKQLTDPPLSNLVANLHGSFTVDANWPSQQADRVLQGWLEGVGPYAPAASDQVIGRLKDIAGKVSDAAGVVKQVDGYLIDVTNALAQIEAVLAKDISGNRHLASSIVQQLVGKLAAEFAGSFVDAKVNSALKNLDPTFNQISTTLADLRKFVGEARGKLATGSEFQAELNHLIASPAFVAEFHTIVAEVRRDVTNAFGQFSVDYSVSSPFLEYSDPEIIKMIRQKLEDRFFASKVAAGIQVVLKQRLYDVDASIREAVDSAFQQFNAVIKDIISETLAGVDKSISGFISPLDKAIGAGQINGYAHIDGDSLKLLRLDGHFEFKVPDSMEFNAFLQIKELDSDGSNSCSIASGKASEVTVGARDVSLDWISPSLRANIGGKFAFRTSPGFAPLGMGGCFELTGPLNFETFQITELGATMAFGELENYFGAKARVKLNKYEFAGGIFFGRTCSIDPLMLVDPEVAAVLPGVFPVTGAYVYAEGWFPINEALGIPSSCFFNVRAGIGAGAFFFLVGPMAVPTYGGKMLLGLDGEVLCIVSVHGEVRMIGVKSGGDLTLHGKGTLRGELGHCPFCIGFNKSVGLTYKNSLDHPGAGDWKVDF